MFSFDGNLRQFSLDNGLRVALLRMPVNTVHARLRVNYGALHELPGEEGRVHMLEHLLVTGGNTLQTLEETDNVIDTLGSINADTDLDRMHLYVSALPEHLPLALEFLSRNTFHPRFDKVRFLEEVQRASREKEDHESSPFLADLKEYLKILLGKGPHTYDIGGEWRSIEGTTRENLLAIYNRGFFPNNMILYVIGALPDNTETLVREYFSGANSGPSASFEFPQVPRIKRLIRLHTSAPDLENKSEPKKSKAYFGMGVVVPPNRHEDSYAVRMLASVLGDTGFSRLFKRVSQRQGLSYWVEANYDGSNNKGIFEITAQIASDKIGMTLDAIFSEVKRAQEQPVGVPELNRLRDQEVFRVAEQLEDKLGVVAVLERGYDDGLTPDEYLRRMLAVTPQQICEAANNYLPKSPGGGYVLFIRDPLKVESA